MGMLGKVARGMLIGGANYFGLMAQRELEERKAAVLAAREQAFEKLRQKGRLEEVEATAAANAGLERVKTDEDIRKTRETAPILTEAKIKEVTAKEAAEYGTWLKKQPVELQNTLTIEDFRQDRQDRRTSFQEDRQDGRAREERDWRADNTGATDVLNERGEVVRAFPSGRVQTLQGSRPNRAPPADEKTIEEQYQEIQGTRSRGMMPAAAPAADYLQWDQLKAEIAMDPRFKNLSSAEKIAKARELATLGGIPTRPGE